MTDKELLYIKTIAEERNISGAAKKLFMTQPALSHCLGTLEKEIGTPLFIRTPWGMNMTYAGECYYSMAIDILDIYNDYQQKIVDISNMRRGRVRMGMTRYISAMIAPEVLPEFSAQYPNVEVQIHERNSVELEHEISKRRIDFAVIHIFDSIQKKIASDLVYQQLDRDNFCIVLKKDTELIEKAVRMTGYAYPVLDPKHLDGYPFILETPGHRMREVVEDILKRVNIEPRVLLETELFETAYRLAKVGYGATIINERYLRVFTDIEECAVFSIPKKYKPYWHLCLIKLAHGYMPFASQTLIDMIVQEENEI